MPNSFTEVFGGQNINPSQLSYYSYETDESLTLSWPFEALDGANPLAAKIDVETIVPSLSITFPDATLASTGQDALVTNVGSNTFTVLNAAGVTIGTVASGEAWYFYLTDNSTEAGIWRSVQFGSGTSSASAASLAGAGLEAVVTLLQQDLPSYTKAGDYSPVAADRATVLRSTGGVVVFTPAAAATLGDGWFVYVINSGSGTLTWNPDGSETIDGQSTKVFQPDENAIIFCDGSNFWTVGYGRAVSSTVTAISINVAGSTTPVTLNATQVAAQVQTYTGAMTANHEINYGTGVGYWLVYNNTSGAYSLTLRVNGSDPGVAITQGNYSIVRSDGSNMAVAFTATSGTVTSVATTSELTGGPITSSGTLDLSATGVAAGSYGGALAVPILAISAKGRITSASTAALGTAAGYNVGTTAGTIPVLNAYGLLDSANGGCPTGQVASYISSTVSPGGWVFTNGLSIGSATSGATGRANADTVALFTLLWNSFANAQAAVSGGRGASAAADFAANKTITLPDIRGRSIFAPDSFGGSADAGRLSAAYGASNIVPGATGGYETRTATVTVSGTTSGSLPLTLNVGITSTALDPTPSGSNGGPSTPVSGNHYHTIDVNGTTSGSLSVSASGTSSAFVTIPNSILIPAIIKL